MRSLNDHEILLVSGGDGENDMGEIVVTGPSLSNIRAARDYASSQVATDMLIVVGLSYFGITGEAALGFLGLSPGEAAVGAGLVGGATGPLTDAFQQVLFNAYFDQALFVLENGGTLDSGGGTGPGGFPDD